VSGWKEGTPRSFLLGTANTLRFTRQAFSGYTTGGQWTGFGEHDYRRYAQPPNERKSA